MSDRWNAIFQNCWYVGNNFNCILYGAELVMYFETIVLIQNTRKRQHDAGAQAHDHRLFIFLSTGLLCLITVYLFAQNFFGEEMWIVHAGYPGGSGQYYADNAAVWYQTMGSAASVVLNWMSDAFLIYRVYILWEQNLYVIIVPSILYLGTVVLGIMTCYYSGRPGGDFFVGIAPRIALTYSTVGIAMNVLCSSLICGYIISQTTTSGNSSDGAPRLNRGARNAINVVVESMLPYTLFGVAYVTLLGLDSPVAILFLSLYVMFTCLSPQMIMLRVLLGRGWKNDRLAQSGDTGLVQDGPRYSVGQRYSVGPPYSVGWRSSVATSEL
ncbi:hypothetical protein GSI_03290 [Ganoderma sinense ZZ0214-1]|uniref:Uncharacterized protein n=1 Tax=Ganoderma sinense ZZ0214-1 TaxID=1077348 RepID=A0A2G8SL72_9APHY|nr:hypothetical protein GSI_03290 [Ganoderma sinense ZZ0214-1]